MTVAPAKGHVTTTELLLELKVHSIQISTWRKSSLEMRKRFLGERFRKLPPTYPSSNADIPKVQASNIVPSTACYHLIEFTAKSD